MKEALQPSIFRKGAELSEGNRIYAIRDNYQADVLLFVKDLESV